jgi:hypothetical protein
MVLMHVVEPLVPEPFFLDFKSPFNSKGLISPFISLIKAELIQRSS